MINVKRHDQMKPYLFALRMRVLLSMVKHVQSTTAGCYSSRSSCVPKACKRVPAVHVCVFYLTRYTQEIALQEWTIHIVQPHSQQSILQLSPHCSLRHMFHQRPLLAALLAMTPRAMAHTQGQYPQCCLQNPQADPRHTHQ